VRLAASNDTLAAFDDDTAAVLRQLHPSRSAPTCDFPALSLQENDLNSAIKSFLAGSAGGLDGLRSQHLKDMTSPITGIAGQRLIAPLMEFCNMYLTGVVPLAIPPILYGASLCVEKERWSVRPIAVGSTLHHLVAKVACRSGRKEMVTKLAPVQLGLGIQLGAEAATLHAARSFLSYLSSGQALRKIDFSNAFATLHRKNMLGVVREEMSEKLQFIRSCCSRQSFLLFGQYVLLSDEGTQKGDTLQWPASLLPHRHYSRQMN
jgi:hypothetical protein